MYNLPVVAIGENYTLPLSDNSKKKLCNALWFSASQLFGYTVQPSVLVKFTNLHFCANGVRVRWTGSLTLINITAGLTVGLDRETLYTVEKYSGRSPANNFMPPFIILFHGWINSRDEIGLKNALIVRAHVTRRLLFPVNLPALTPVAS